MAVEPDDWRLGGQERYLSGVTLYWRRWTQTRPGWDHDHCEFCWAKFMDLDETEVLREGYCTADEYYWVCRQCFIDFAAMMGMTEAPETGEKE